MLKYIAAPTTLGLFSLLISTLFLTSCEPAPKRGKDGYYFEKETFTRTEFPVEIVLVKSEQEMTDLIKQNMTTVAGEVDPKMVAAFSVIRMNETRCTIYMLDPKVSYQPEFIGHELVHCIYGVWHSEPQDGRSTKTLTPHYNEIVVRSNKLQLLRNQ